MTSLDTLNNISSLASEAGLSPSASQGGLHHDLFGLVPVPASRSRKQDKEKAKPMNGISGPCSVISSPSASLQSRLENKLRARLDVNGSPEYVLTWKAWDMKSGPPICALRARARPTSGNDSSGWPTPMAGTPAQKGYNAAGNTDYSRRVVEALRVANSGGQRRQQDAGSSSGDEEAHGRTGRLGSEPNGDNQSASDGENGHGMEHATSNGREQWGTESGRWGAECGRGAWDRYDILPCTDGKARRVESGTFPLAHGLPGRVGLLRGYGNAIVPQVAATFVRSFSEIQYR